MLTNNLIDDLTKELMKKYEYKMILKPLKRNERRKWVNDFLMNSNIKTLDDSMFKYIFSGNDNESCRLIQFIFKTYLNIEINQDEIISIRNELNRQHASAKTAILDCLYSYERLKKIIDIEPQSKISRKRLMPKLERYLATMRVYEKNIGTKDESDYAFLHLLCFYEKKYKGNYLENTIVEVKDGCHWIRFADQDGLVDVFSKQDIRIIDLLYSTIKFYKEGMENMSERNMFEFALANAHVMNDEVQKAINKMAETSQAVRDLLSKRYQYLAKPENRYDSIKHQMNLNTQYYEGVDHGIEKGIKKGVIKEREEHRQDYYQRVVRRFKMNYLDDTSFLQDLSLEAYKELYEMIIDGVSIEDIKNYVDILR